MKKVRGHDVTKEYLHFAETLGNDDLGSLRSLFNKNINELLRPGNPVIIEMKKTPGQYFLYTILGTNLDNSRNFLDNQKLRALLDQGVSYSEAVIQCLGLFFVTECLDVSSLSAPDHPMVRREFIAFQKEFRKEKKELSSLIEEHSYVPPDTAFGNVNELRRLEKEPAKNRAEMENLKKVDPEKFHTLWIRGEYHLATIIARLEQTDYKETLLMREEVLKRNNISVAVKDYGFTIAEILAGLQAAKKMTERYWYKAFAEGNVNLYAMILIIRNYHMVNPEHQFTANQTIQALANDYDMRQKTDPSKYETIRQFIRKYKLPVHPSWQIKETNITKTS